MRATIMPPRPRPSLLAPSDVIGRGHHAGGVARATPGKGAAVIGDGTVGLCGVIAAKRVGAERTVLLGRHADRIAPARELGATDVVGERGEEAVARTMEITGGGGAHSVLACGGADQAMDMAVAIVRPGGAVGRVGVPHHDDAPLARSMFFENVTMGGGPAPVRGHMKEFLPDVMGGRIGPGREFDRATDLDGVPDAYRVMNGREAIKVMVRP